MQEPKPRLDSNLSEAEIFIKFMQCLRNKPADLIFNVPRGKLDRLDKNYLKYFLCVNGANRQKLLEPLERSGWQALPFFVIDPFSRSEFPSLSNNLTEGSFETRQLEDAIAQTCLLFE
jgi:hypothetical protein